jgi:hypothetical protein
MNQNFFWACSRDDQPAGDRFIIADGQDELWRRAGVEIISPINPAWHPVNCVGQPTDLGDILHMLLNTVPQYGVSHNKFLLEAAQIPVFAEFIRAADYIPNYVSNPLHEAPLLREPYDSRVCARIEAVVKQALGLTGTAA